ncbi:ATP-binding protein [Candidatus Dependentiae bacterium]|nr:ATP-binding protein [Candidatus Dependentiae bacterium]
MKYIYLFLLLTPQFSFSMLRGIYRLQPLRSSFIRTFATLTETQKILYMKRLEELGKRLDEVEKDSIFKKEEFENRTHAVAASKILANSEAKKRILDIEKEIFEIKIKLQEK